MQDDYDISGFANLCDGTEDWLLTRFHQHNARVIIRLPARLQVHHLAAIRKLLPGYRDSPPAETRQRLQGRGELALGPFGPQYGHDLAHRARALGLEVEVIEERYTSYLPIQRVGEQTFSMIIEDDDAALRVCQKMLAAGVPVRDSLQGDVSDTQDSGD